MVRMAVLMLALVASGCSSTSQGTQPARPSGPSAPVQLTEAERAQVERAVRTRLANEAATFRTIIAQGGGGATTVCGYVNPGTGDTPFIGTLSGGAFTLTDVGGPTERTIAVQKACHARGIYT